MAQDGEAHQSHYKERDLSATRRVGASMVGTSQIMNSMCMASTVLVQMTDMYRQKVGLWFRYDVPIELSVVSRVVNALSFHLHCQQQVCS